MPLGPFFLAMNHEEATEACLHFSSGTSGTDTFTKRLPAAPSVDGRWSPRLVMAGGAASWGRDRLSGNEREEELGFGTQTSKMWCLVSAVVLGGEVGPRVGQYR